MPKINAPTVAEHRQQIQAQLVEAAEQIMRSKGVDALTAGEVSTAAGIARNSLYRYVDSVDDLRALVMTRHLPVWSEAVVSAVDSVTDPRERLLAWVMSNLEQAAQSGHGWLMTLAQHSGSTMADWPSLSEVHTRLISVVVDAWHQLCPEHAALLAQLTSTMLTEGFAWLDSGAELANVQKVLVESVDAVISRFTSPSDATN